MKPSPEPQPKYPIGTRVSIINENHRNGEVGYLVKIKKVTVLNTFTRYIYYIKFKDGTVSSFFEASIKEEPNTFHMKKNDFMAYTEKKIKSIGSISMPFTEADIQTHVNYNESAAAPSIRTVTRKDVTSKHFTNWFFKLDNWVGTNPNEFPLHFIIHNGTISVYGCFNNDKLDGIIRVDEQSDHCELSFFSVNKALQHQGIGQYLFQYILKRFSDKTLILYVYKDNSPAIHIYKKYGFNIVGVNYNMGYRPESPHYIMQRDAC
jgi:ribosomal protein S18 acetylase RimI-like enzyme